jgi:hypothetical protein
MSEAETLFAGAAPVDRHDVVAMLERMVRDAPDHALNKMNALDLAAKEGIGGKRVIATLMNAVGLGIFEMSWNVTCPSCAGISLLPVKAMVPPPCGYVGNTSLSTILNTSCAVPLGTSETINAGDLVLHG